jgi:lipoate-protein ligase A
MKRWRYIFAGAKDAFWNMALDEAIFQSYQRRRVPPTLRLYLWKPPAISIGYFQTLEKTVDLDKCKKNNVDVVRRITGGRAVLHQDEITYSLCACSEGHQGLGRSTLETYQGISFALLESLKALRIQAEWARPRREKIAFSDDSYFSKPCFVSSARFEITAAGKKLIGSAQKREKSGFIQHGSIPLGDGKISLGELLTDENIGEGIMEKLNQNSTNLERILKRGVECEEVISALKRGFGEFFGVELVEEELTQEELEAARMLRDRKYSTEKWNLGRRRLQIREV